MKRILFMAAMLAGVRMSAAIVIQNPQVEYRKTPLGIDVAEPRFSWQMSASAGERGYAQTAYRIEVADAAGTLWDSGRMESSISVGIRYAGPPLKAATRYFWTVTVWDQTGTPRTARSWFETGLMTAAGWSGAQWIGGGQEDLVLYAPYLSIFDLHYGLTIPAGSTRAAFVYGANDSRLMDRNKNLFQLASAKDASYIKIELDISATDGSPGGKAKLNIYRAGYSETDDPRKPLKTLEVSPDVIRQANKNAEHIVEFSSVFGQLTLSIDGAAEASPVDVNPAGAGGDHLPFGMLCDIGFSVDPGQKATFRDVIVRNNRAPRNILFEEFSGSDGGYVIEGGAKGAFLVRDPSRNSAPMLRTAFKAAKAIESARLYVTARGIYEIYLNGRRVGDDYYNPGLTQYNMTHMYQTYDVTGLLKTGDNALGAMLGEGWWSGLLSFGTAWNHFGDRQSLLVKLAIAYKDGTTETIASNDRTWKYFSAGPIVYSSLDQGEVYDAARERAVEGWSTAAYDDRAWKSARVVPLEGTAFIGKDTGYRGMPVTPIEYDKLKLVGQVGDSARVFLTLTAKRVKQVRPGVFVYDMGQNMVGVPRIHIADGRAGAKITLRYAEMLYPALPEYGRNAGMIMTENYRAALSQDVYTMKAGAQVFQPRFTSHGYQYLELTGVANPLPLSAVEGVAISSVHELSSDYRTSNEKVNRLWRNLVWSNVDNFLTIPTDCPQRNERMGWSGDINVFSRTATYVSNADQFLTRHMFAMRDVQEPTGRFTDVAPVGSGFGGVLWGSAGIVVPWEVYLQYNDLGLLERHYPAMAAYLDYLESTLDPKTGLSSDAALGDWLGPQNDILGSAFLATAYHAYDLEIMARVAEALGKTGEAAKYRARFQQRKAFFNRTFFNQERKTLATGGPYGQIAMPPVFRVADTQTSYAVALGMGLVGAEDLPAVAAHLADSVARENKDDQGKLLPEFSLMTGFIGTAWISQALSGSGRSDLAYRLLLNERYPSWLYPVDQGATTIWERLNGYTVENGFGGNNGMNSFNHYSFGAVGQWLIAYSLGIQRDEPGFRKFILRPEPDPTGTMAWAEGFYDSVYGRIGSSWRIDGKRLIYRASVPANTTAVLYLPLAGAVQEGGADAAKAKGVAFIRNEGGKAVYLLSSGTYEFTASR